MKMFVLILVCQDEDTMIEKIPETPTIFPPEKIKQHWMRILMGKFYFLNNTGLRPIVFNFSFNITRNFKAELGKLSVNF